MLKVKIPFKDKKNVLINFIMMIEQVRKARWGLGGRVGAGAGGRYSRQRSQNI